MTEIDASNHALGAYLRKVRLTRNLSQAELAEATGLSIDTIGRIERGKVVPSFETLRKLAEALGIEAETLARLAHTDKGPAMAKNLPSVDTGPVSRDAPPSIGGEPDVASGPARGHANVATVEEGEHVVVGPTVVEVYNHDFAIGWRGSGAPDTLFHDLLTQIRRDVPDVALPTRDYRFWFVAVDDPSEREWELQETLGECLLSCGNPDHVTFNLRLQSRVHRG